MQPDQHPNTGFQSDARNHRHFGIQAQAQHGVITPHVHAAQLKLAVGAYYVFEHRLWCDVVH